MPLKDSRARAEEALRLRARRKTWTEISAELGFRSRDGARLAVNRLLKSVSADPGHVALERAVSSASLAAQEPGLFELYEAAVKRGDDEAAATLSRELRSLVTDRAKLAGLYAPQAVSVDVKLSLGDLIAQAKQRLLALDNTVDAEVIE
ncbi:hypothetical protein BST27_29695 [Mycobacterium intermedium]|uniref:Uncharacterized protein n=2 Tax=Mycobacterium intermedium TaxID=28445 RepID=A0A1E3SDY8_MYCIE|nr:hypothetical protein BHQ20_13355 [Mycobacterium intermedium]OPE51046.1 hypothetical protein BV508_07720 [Mycobacterium intermedium]ORA90513.1 hypothetical protein BST27_29695 [Mycobacterium intermedium]